MVAGVVVVGDGVVELVIGVAAVGVVVAVAFVLVGQNRLGQGRR